VLSPFHGGNRGSNLGAPLQQNGCVDFDELGKLSKTGAIVGTAVTIPFYVAGYYPPEPSGDRHPPHQHTELSSSITTAQANIIAQDISTSIVHQVPFSQLDWPVPRGAVPDITLRTWVHPLNLNLLG